MKKATEGQSLKITEQTNTTFKPNKPPYQMLSHEIARNKKLSDGAKSLYIYLNSHNETFNLSIDKIAANLNKSTDTIKRHLKELKRAGFIVLEREQNKNRYIYKCLDTPSNKDFLIQEIIKKGDFEELMKLYNKDIANNPTITQQTKEELTKAIQVIAKINLWIKNEEN